MFRPEGWFNAFTVEAGNLHLEAEKEANIYESGADAMLECLRKQGEHQFSYFSETTVSITIPVIDSMVKGTFVFIPDEVEK